MAQVQDQPIVVGNRGIGTVSINGGAIRGEGGALHPQLVMPLKFDLNNYPSESMLAVCRVKATLGPGQNVFAQDALCRPIVEDLTDGFPVHTIPSGSVSNTVDLRFWLTSAEVEHIESLRHRTQSNTFTLYVSLEAWVAGVKTFNEMKPGSQPPASPWEFNYGLFSQLFPFWTCRITTMPVQVDQSHWIDDVLPGLGYDRLRLLELSFPSPLPDHSNAAAQFDRARKALDQRRYGDCISECRGLLNMWEQQYGVEKKKQRLADFIAIDRRWPEGDIRRQLLDRLWKEVGDVANAPHHPEGDVNAELFNERDARLVLVLTAALSEYVEPR
jgi:hypothetical protein